MIKNQEIYNLYAKLLKMKFPDLDTVTLLSDEEIEKHVSYKRYQGSKGLGIFKESAIKTLRESENSSLPVYILDVLTDSRY